MLTKSLLLIGACHIASAVAAKLEFTFTGKTITVGESKTLTWSGGDSDQPVQIYLYKGPGPYDPSNALSEIATAATGTTYVWTPAESLVNGNDYTLEVAQNGQTNYVGPDITIKGSSATSSSASGSASASATASSSSAAQTSHAVVGGSHGSNSTAPATTAASNSSATAVGTAASAGTGTSIHRNQTMSKATLSKHTTATSTISFTTGSASTPSSTEGSSSSSSPAPTSKSGATGLASSFALVLAGVVAVIYIG